MQGALTRPLRANLMMEALLDRGFLAPVGAMPTVVIATRIDDMDGDAAQEALERIALHGADLLEGADVPDDPEREPQLLGVLGLHDEDQDSARRIGSVLVDRVNRNRELGRVDVQAPLGADRIDGQVAERELIRVCDEPLCEGDDRLVIVILSPRLRGMTERMHGFAETGFERKRRDRNHRVRKGPKAPLAERECVLFDRGLGRNVKEFQLAVAVRREHHDVIPNGIVLGLGCGLVGFDAPRQAQNGCQNAEVQGVYLQKICCRHFHYLQHFRAKL